jgi:hypothetical protein
MACQFITCIDTFLHRGGGLVYNHFAINAETDPPDLQNKIHSYDQ